MTLLDMRFWLFAPIYRSVILALFALIRFPLIGASMTCPISVPDQYVGRCALYQISEANNHFRYAGCVRIESKYALPHASYVGR